AAADQLRAAKQQLQEKDTALQKAELLRKVLLIACGVLLLLLLIQTIRAGIYKGRAAKAAETPSFYDTERSGETEAEPGLQDPSGVQDTPGVQDPAGTQDFLQPQGPGPQQAPGIQEAPGIQQAPDIQEAPGIPQGSGDTGSDYFPSTGAVTQESAESTEDRIRTQNQILGDFDAFKEAASRPGMSGGD
ncbi:MAG: hypothetical protein IKG66_03640, partial [Lachnospiraceae bacterium]|nr:hypothetical protein [Lachnospiraceae bacterium]